MLTSSFRAQARWLRTALTGLLMTAPLLATAATDLMAYTEEWPPYNYLEDTKVKGISSDILRAACEVAQLRCTQQLVPWARAYKIVSNTPNTVLYTTARKPAREALFVWVGPILPRSTWVYTRAEHTALKEFKDLGSLRVGVVREEAAQADLLQAGVPATAMVEESSNPAVLRMLLSDMVDAMVDTEAGMAWNLRSLGRPASSVSRQLKLSEDGAYYFALGLKSDPGKVRKLQAAVEKLKHDGRLDAIVRTYEPSP